MSLKEQLVREVEPLNENDLKSVLDFVSFLKFRSYGEHGEEEDAKFWQGASASSLNAIWNNAEDDVYGDLLKA